MAEPLLRLPLPASESLAGLTSGLFVQTECHRVMAATSLLEEYGLGIVYTVDPRRRKYAKSDLTQAVMHTRTKARGAAIMVDASYYTGSRRRLASEPPGKDWVSFQRNRLNLPWALTDSGYCAAGNTSDLDVTLKCGAALGSGVITALPVAVEWLTHDAHILRSRIDEQTNPVALMVENALDPFDEVDAVAGLVEVIATEVPVILLRSDTAALGALAYGAAAAAVGTRSSLRHFYPSGPGGGPSNHLHFMIPALLGYYLNSRFENAYAADPSLRAWRCGCTYCGGQDLSWITNATEPHECAFQHSVAAIAELGYALAAAGTDGPSTWAQMCATAQLEHFAVQNPNGSNWEPKKALAEWLRVTPSRVGK